REFGCSRRGLVKPVELGDCRHARGILQHRQLRSVGEAVVCLAVEFSASLALMDAAPLLEEERDSGSLALIPKRQHPFLLHRPGTRPALTADDHPVDSVKADLA